MLVGFVQGLAFGAQLLHLGARAFDTLTGEVVQTAATIFIQRRASQSLRTTFIDARAGRNENEKEQSIRDRTAPCYVKQLALFKDVAGSPVAVSKPAAVRTLA